MIESHNSLVCFLIKKNLIKFSLKKLNFLRLKKVSWLRQAIKIYTNALILCNSCLIVLNSSLSFKSKLQRWLYLHKRFKAPQSLWSLAKQGRWNTSIYKNSQRFATSGFNRSKYKEGQKMKIKTNLLKTLSRVGCRLPNIQLDSWKKTISLWTQ